MTTPLMDYERTIQELYEALLRPGDVAIDVGAHEGRHTFPMAERVFPDGKILAFEPLPDFRQSIQDRISPDYHPLIKLLPHALYDKSGVGSLVVPRDYPAFSGLKQTPYPGETSIERIPIALETIDNWLPELDSLRFVKIDAEGAELHILRGAGQTLEKYRPLVCFEFGYYSNREFHVLPEEMAIFWTEHGYHLYGITGDQLDYNQFCQCAQQRIIWDYVAVPAEDYSLNLLVQAILQRPRINWLAVQANLDHAEDHLEPGTKIPPCQSVWAPFRPLAQGIAWLFLQTAKTITIPQALYNRSLLASIQELKEGLEKAEKECHRRDIKIHHLCEELELLKQELAHPKEEEVNSIP